MNSTNEFRSLTRIEKAQVILDLARKCSNNADILVCEPNFSSWLQSELEKAGYDMSRYFSGYTYESAFSLLKSLGLIVSLNTPHTSGIGRFRVDSKTTIEQAKSLKKRINSYFTADLVEIFDRLDSDPANAVDNSNSKITIIELERTVGEQAAEIVRLRALVKDTLQEAQNFAKNTRKKLNQA